ncbi:hypothetical protein T459_05443 [Capsicum annuum]|uniref:Gag-pro-like protein n=1 Tax=Capsicum annuum TaxID=4072 RepID=A0A2G3A813_CAPAN|nr:hypothetical protein T459_05443 [Capsicum annuum]
MMLDRMHGVLDVLNAFSSFSHIEKFYSFGRKMPRAPLPSEAPTFNVNPTIVIPHSTSNPVLNIFSDQHYASEPIFKSIGLYDYTQPPEFPPNTEKPVRTEEQEKMDRKLRSLELTMKNLQGLGGYKSVSYKDLCMFPGLHLSLGFKMPKFEKYDGHGDPVAHLRRYCNQLRGAGEKKELLMAYFGESLSVIQKCSGSVGGNKNEEDASAIVVGQQAWARGPHHRYPWAQTQVYAQAPQNLSQNPLYSNPLSPYQVYDAQPYVQPPSYPHWRVLTLSSHPLTPHTYRSPSRPGFQFKPNNEMRQKSRDRFTPIGESYASLFQRLVQRDIITPLLGYTPDPHSRNFDPNVQCAYHSNVQGHSIEDCRALKREIEKIIQDKSIMVQNIDSEESSSHADMQTSG